MYRFIQRQLTTHIITCLGIAGIQSAVLLVFIQIKPLIQTFCLKSGNIIFLLFSESYCLGKSRFYTVVLLKGNISKQVNGIISYKLQYCNSTSSFVTESTSSCCKGNSRNTYRICCSLFQSMYKLSRHCNEVSHERHSLDCNRKQASHETIQTFGTINLHNIPLILCTHICKFL